MKLPTHASVFHSLRLMMTVLTVAALACLLWAVRFERPYLSYANLPFPATASVRPGEVIELQVARCNGNRRTSSYESTRALRNLNTGEVALLPAEWVDVPPGCTLSVSRINKVPVGTAPGRYTVFGRALVSGLLINYRVPWESQPFDVLPAAPAKEK